MRMKRHFMMFAAYNRWANGRIYDAASDLLDEEFTAMSAPSSAP